ncbi:hypothetical protein EXIGLDRAFT_762868 [Exidia glandulosa HHB12029]|uniref:Amidohydrolase-related domain-containing protein n=1 Tax=Exidia glandulosa HHB12029 TaxID=1314781 RepID=A0A165MD93_EXIGL|nr:hypothetical protein EXIGLDRAFT_762868 [Exidia glandulosa HHB12029]
MSRAQCGEIPRWYSAHGNTRPTPDPPYAAKSAVIVATMQAIQKYASDGDELDLAKTLALLIREDPLSVSFEEETCSLRFGYERGLGPRQCGFPFDDWRDILLRCVSALDTLPPDEPVALPHDAGDFAVADVKDILLIQHAFLHGDLKQAVDIAKTANARRPDDVFFHYALSLHMETSFDVRDVYSIVTDKYDRLDEADDPVATKTGTYCMMLRNISMAAFWFGMSIQFKEDYSKEEWGTVKFMVYAASTMADRYIEDYGRVDGRDKEMMVAVRFLAQTVMRAGLPAPGSRKAPLIGEVWEGQTAIAKGIWWGLRRHQKVHDVMDLFVREGNEAEDIWGRTLREMFPNHPTREDEVHPRFHAGASEVQVQWWKEVDVVMWARRWRNADRTTPVPWRFIPNPLILPLALPHYDSLHIHGCGGCTGRSSLAPPGTFLATAHPTASMEATVKLSAASVPPNRLMRPSRRTMIKQLAILGVASALAVASRRVAWTRPPSGNSELKDWKDDVFPLVPRPADWDISTDYAYPRRVNFTVDEGTWLRLDVHPVTGEIVFDMLGDIYCLPPTGGEARPVLVGAPFDSDPQFSPTGDRLLFKSDAGHGVFNMFVTLWTGCDNLAVRPLRSTHESGATVQRADLREALRLQASDEELLSSGIAEDALRRRRRLVREGRLNARRVTNETQWYLAGARFHPSGRSIIASKIYDIPSEAWAWPLPSVDLLRDSAAPNTVGSGKRLIGRRLPRFWPSTEYGNVLLGPEMVIPVGNDEVIYSVDQADLDGVGAFTYNKDVHKGAYALYRMNMTSGEERLLVSHKPGGASRPELSHDGRTLAFVRRVRDKQALVLLDLQTGNVRNAWYGLSYDRQILWAGPDGGTYPSFSFTPRDDAIVIWTAGKIWQVPLSVLPTGERTEEGSPRVLPFVVDVQLRLAETLKTRRSVSNDTKRQRVHTFTGLRVNDDASRAVLSDHGNTYVVDLSPSHGPVVTPLPKTYPDAPYYTPAFVPGSELFIHARWSNSRFSTFELVSLPPAQPRVLTGIPPGRYFAPAVSLSSGQRRRIAWVQCAGDAVTGHIRHTTDHGLYMGTIDLGTAHVHDVRLISREIRPSRALKLRFFAGERFLIVEDAKSAYALDLERGESQIPLAAGNFTREVATALAMNSAIWSTLGWETSALATSASAFMDFDQLYVTRTKGVPLFSGTRGNAAPDDLIKVSVTGGHDIVWSEDGETLSWLFGPELRQAKLSQLLRVCGKVASQDRISFGSGCADSVIAKWPLRVTSETSAARLDREALATSAPSGNVWIVNATLLTMKTAIEDEDVVPSSAILLQAGHISRIVNMMAFEVEDTPGSTVLDLSGYVLPGFIDAHAHWQSGDSTLFPASSWELEAYLAYGVTTVFNPATLGFPYDLERNRVESGVIIGPRIFHSGTPAMGLAFPVPEIVHEINSLEEATAMLDRISAEQGPSALFYKNYLLPSRASRQRLLTAARNRSMLSVPEGGMTQDFDLTYLIDGFTSIEHSLPTSELFEDVKQLWVASGAASTPTHLVNYGGAFGEQLMWGPHIPWDEKLREFIPHSILEGLAETTSRPPDSWQLYNTSASTADLARRGVPVLIGAHGQPPIGYGFHMEMYLTQAGGLSSYETLRAATRSAAEVYGLFDSIGSIEEGKLADLVVYPPGVNVLTSRLPRTLDM